MTATNDLILSEIKGTRKELGGLRKDMGSIKENVARMTPEVERWKKHEGECPARQRVFSGTNGNGRMTAKQWAGLAVALVTGYSAIILATVKLLTLFQS